MNETKQTISTEQKKRTIEKSAYRERGQAMVETAFVMIILLLLLSVIIDLGRAFFTYLALQNAAAEGAYYAAKDPVSLDNTVSPDPDNITFRVKHESPDSALIDWNTDDVTVNVTFWCPNGDPIDHAVKAPPGSFVMVEVEYQFETIGPVAGMLAVAYNLAGRTVEAEYWEDWDGTFTLRAETRQIVLEADNAHVPC